MKRDCGQCELKISSYSTSSSNGTDRQTKHRFNSLKEAKEFYDGKELKPHTNIRIYACDKEGYANCILYKYMDADGIVSEVTNRLKELEMD